MTPVNTPRGTGEAAPVERGHYVCGVVGLGAVVALFLTQYAAIVALVDGALGLLGSTAIVWLFFALWLVVWLVVDVVLLQLSRGRRLDGPSDA